MVELPRHTGPLRLMFCDVAIPEPVAPQVTRWLCHNEVDAAENLCRVLL